MKPRAYPALPTLTLQRVGFLYGSYKKDDSMEYGVKAVVEAVYEPPQRCTATDFVLPADPMEGTVNRVAGAWVACNLRQHVLAPCIVATCTLSSTFAAALSSFSLSMAWS